MYPSTGALLAVVAAISFGVQVLLVDYGMALASDRLGERPAVVAAFLTLLSSVPVLWLIYLLRGGPVVTFVPLALAPFVLGGIADPALARLCYYEGIERVGPSIASAITAGSPAIAAIVAIPALGARPTGVELVGLVAIVCGVAGLQLVRRAGTESEAARVDLLRRQLAAASGRDLLYPIGAMTLIGLAFVLTKFGLGAMPDPVTATVVTHSAALGTFVAAFAGRTTVVRRPQLPWRATAVLLLAGMVLALGWLAMLSALYLGTVVTVLPLVSTYPLVVVVASYAIARSRPRSPLVLGAILLILVGAGLLQGA